MSRVPVHRSPGGDLSPWEGRRWLEGFQRGMVGWGFSGSAPDTPRRGPVEEKVGLQAESVPLKKDPTTRSSEPGFLGWRPGPR